MRYFIFFICDTVFEIQCIFLCTFQFGQATLKVLRTHMASSYCVKHCSFNIWALLAHTNGSSMSGTFHVHTGLKEIVPDFFFLMRETHLNVFYKHVNHEVI